MPPIIYSNDTTSNMWDLAGGRGCGKEELTVPLSSNQTVANITGLTPGCCYGVTVFLANGSILAKNRNVSGSWCFMCNS